MKTIVVFNLFDHESLTAAALSSEILKHEQPEDEVELLDIRDCMCDADKYLWIGVGDEKELSSYYGQVISPKDWSMIALKSQFVNKDGQTASLGIQGTLHYRTLVAVGAADSETLFLENWGPLARWSPSAIQYHEVDMSPDAVLKYERLIEDAYLHYTSGEKFTSIDLLPGNDGAASQFGNGSYKESLLERSRGFSESNRTTQAMKRKTREYVGVGVSYTQVTDTGISVYNLLRRLSLSKRNWFHYSSGLYKNIVFAGERNKLTEPNREVYVIETKKGQQ